MKKKQLINVKHNKLISSIIEQYLTLNLDTTKITGVKNEYFRVDINKSYLSIGEPINIFFTINAKKLSLLGGTPINLKPFINLGFKFDIESNLIINVSSIGTNNLIKIPFLIDWALFLEIRKFVTNVTKKIEFN